eukprot:354169-Chlamydomonas_euryale.AAC.18
MHTSLKYTRRTNDRAQPCALSCVQDKRHANTAPRMPYGVSMPPTHPRLCPSALPSTSPRLSCSVLLVDLLKLRHAAVARDTPHASARAHTRGVAARAAHATASCAAAALFAEAIRPGR